MSNKIGRYDYDSLHVLHEGSGVHSLFERRLKRIEVTPEGKTVSVIPDDAGLDYILNVSLKGNRLVQGWVLVPVRETAGEEA